jgi:hypothetical protein
MEIETLSPLVGVKMLLLLPPVLHPFEVSIWLDSKTDGEGAVQLPVCPPSSSRKDLASCGRFFGWLEAELLLPLPVVELLLLLSLVLLLFELSFWFVMMKDLGGFQYVVWSSTSEDLIFFDCSFWWLEPGLLLPLVAELLPLRPLVLLLFEQAFWLVSDTVSEGDIQRTVWFPIRSDLVNFSCSFASLQTELFLPLVLVELFLLLLLVQLLFEQSLWLLSKKESEGGIQWPVSSSSSSSSRGVLVSCCCSFSLTETELLLPPVEVELLLLLS